jgi:hypothetical protein
MCHPNLIVEIVHKGNILVTASLKHAFIVATVSLRHAFIAHREKYIATITTVQEQEETMERHCALRKEFLMIAM